MKHIMIVGAGASGLTAALTAARQISENRAECRITLIEQEEKVGRKLSATGNGRCNFTNLNMDQSCYHSDEPSFPMQVIGRFGTDDTLRFFEQIGIKVRTRNGGCYPWSGQASSVTEALLKECLSYGVSIHCNTHISNILKEEEGFAVVTGSRYIYHVDKLILACGSAAGGLTQSAGSGCQLAQSLGHEVIPMIPALVALRTNLSDISSLAGIRIDGKVSLMLDDAEIESDRGEIQFTDYGISGIPVFQISGTCSELLAEGKAPYAELDLMPDMDHGELVEYLKQRRRDLSCRLMQDFFIGLYPDPLAKAFRKRTDISPKQLTECLEDAQIEQVANVIRHFHIPVTRTNSMKQAQVARGGVSVRQVDPATMESTLHPGLYVTGELLNVDGICGGYNLQFAWSSGYLAGMDAVASLGLLPC